MASKVISFILLLLATFAMAGTANTDVSLSHSWDSNGHSDLEPACDGSLGPCTNQQPAEEMSLESQTTQRMLYSSPGYISYGALRRDTVPCNRRGVSYYNCQRGGQANPYRRGCSIITRCARNLD